MFTGIVEERGTVRESGGRLTVAARKVVDDSHPGASVAVNGVCLTVRARTPAHQNGEPGTLSFELSPETVARSSLGRLRPGDPVNLERAVTLLTRLGGHLVQGHVDGLGVVDAVEEAGPGKAMKVRAPRGLERYLADKGSIAVDGVSLTVAGVDGGRFGIALVPYTLDSTTLSATKAGDVVNLEVDVLAKYVEALLGRTW